MLKLMQNPARTIAPFSSVMQKQNRSTVGNFMAAQRRLNHAAIFWWVKLTFPTCCESFWSVAFSLSINPCWWWSLISDNENTFCVYFIDFWDRHFPHFQFSLWPECCKLFCELLRVDLERLIQVRKCVDSTIAAAAAAWRLVDTSLAG